MSTTSVSAGQIMDRVANLLNDPNKTDYTYNVQIPYLNMAIEELSEHMAESNISASNQTAVIITVPAGAVAIVSEDDPLPVPHYPNDLMEIQEVGERTAGSQDSFVRMTRLEYTPKFPPSSALLYWCWEDQRIKLNNAGYTVSGILDGGAIVDREVQLRYLRQGVPYVADANSPITIINSRSYLCYKTAALCALFIGENENRAKVLEDSADDAIERLESISNKGRQQIMTRHRPFRAGYKMRGWI